MSEILPMHKDHICMITVLRWLLVMVWPCQFYPCDLSMHNAHKVNYPKKKIILFIVCFERKCFCSWDWVWTTWEISQKKIRNYWEEELKKLKSLCAFPENCNHFVHTKTFYIEHCLHFYLFLWTKKNCVGITIFISFVSCSFKVN